MKKYFLYPTLLIFSFTISFANKKEIEVNKEKCTFEIEKGMLEGEYTSYYPNGSIKSNGHFNKNNRVGKWKVYDLNGNVVIEREYKNSLQFVQTIPDNQNSQHNLNNKWDLLTAESIYCHKRFFKVIDKKENEALFKSAEFGNYLIGLVNQNNFQVFEDDRFVNIKNKTIQDLENTTIVSYKIKEDAIIDLRRFVLDYRILGINPIVKLKNGEEKELGWFYFPDLKEQLMKENNPNIQNTLSILLNRNYSSTNYKEITMTSLSNNGDQYVIPENYKNDYQDVSLIEKEHDIWLQFLLAKTQD